MPLSESALIERYFRTCGAQRPDVLAGIGDDAALLAVAPDAELVAATDTLVAGAPGDAAAGLALEQGRLHASAAALAYLRERFLRPTPRIALGQRLRRHASACIDVSDGLLGDAGKLADASRAGVEISFGAVPVSETLLRTLGEERARELALTGGDDCER